MHCHLAVGMRSWPFRFVLAVILVVLWATIAAADTSTEEVLTDETVRYVHQLQ